MGVSGLKRGGKRSVDETSASERKGVVMQLQWTVSELKSKACSK